MPEFVSEAYFGTVDSIVALFKDNAKAGMYQSPSEIITCVRAVVSTHKFTQFFTDCLQVLKYSKHPYAIDAQKKMHSDLPGHVFAAAVAAMEMDVFDGLGDLQSLVHQKQKCAECKQLHIIKNIDGRCKHCHDTLLEKPWGIWFNGHGKDDWAAGWCHDAQTGVESFGTPEEATERLISFWQKGMPKDTYEVRNRISQTPYVVIEVATQKIAASLNKILKPTIPDVTGLVETALADIAKGEDDILAATVDLLE